MRWWAFWILAACGDNLVDEPADHHSGSRLKLYWYEYEDGARELGSRSHFSVNGMVPREQFRDASRDEDCSAMEWVDGITRCTPGILQLPLFGEPTFSATVYADAGCSQIVGRGVPRAADYFLHGEWQANQFYPSLVLRIGSLIDTALVAYYERRDGQCVGPIANDQLTFEVGNPVFDSDLAEIKHREIAATTRIGHLADASDDGMQLRIGFYDHELDAPCDLTTVHGLSTECAPQAASVADLFVDPTCTSPALSTARNVQFAVDYSFATGCSSYFRLGDRITTPVYHHVAGDCIEAPARDGETVFEIGEPVAPAEVDLVPATGERRLVDLRATGTSSAPSVGLFDTDIKTTCTYEFSNFLLDDVRCLPAAWGAQDAFADSNCVEAIQVSLLEARSCDYDERYAAIDFKIYREIDDVIDSAFVRTDAGACVPFSVPPGYALHALGRTALLSELMRGVRVVDP